MSQTPQFSVLETVDGWMVSLPKSMTATGKRVRKFFDTKTAANRYAASCRSSYHEGIRGAVVPATLALQAAEAARILEGSGISVVEAARMAVARVSSTQDAELFKLRYDRTMLDGEMRWSNCYRLGMDRLPRWVPQWFMDLPCGAIDRETMERALLESGHKARSTLDMRIARLSAIIGYQEKHRKGTTIHILSTEQRMALIAACADAQERMAVGLLLYAGIRPDAEHGEISRLDWSAVGKTEVHVSQEDSKVGERLVPITPALQAMIKGHPKSGVIIPAGWKRKWARLRKAAGITVNDVTRHTFASHFLAWRGEDAAKNAMGHTAGSSTLFRHYRRAVTEEAGKAYFGAK